MSWNQIEKKWFAMTSRVRSGDVSGEPADVASIAAVQHKIAAVPAGRTVLNPRGLEDAGHAEPPQ